MGLPPRCEPLHRATGSPSSPGAWTPTGSGGCSRRLERARPPSALRRSVRPWVWRGPALADFTYEPFAQRDATLEELRLEAIEQRVDADMAVGPGSELVAELEALVAEHPFRERLRGQLMLALYRTGRQADALEVYRDARRTLVEELGIEPAAALRQLEQAILRQDPSLDLEPPGAQPVAAPTRGAGCGALATGRA